jgi:hypothetical protein
MIRPWAACCYFYLCYDPAILERGQSIYIDSNMGHAYLVAEGCDEATLISLRGAPPVASTVERANGRGA